MSKSLSNVLKGNNNTVLPAAGNTGNVLTSTGNTWVSSAPAASGASATKTISNKTAAYTVIADDLGKIINCTANTFTVSLTAAATLGSGFTCTILNTSNVLTDAITISPPSGTIDGLSTLTLNRGEGLDIVCDGTNWQIVNKKPMRGYAENIPNTYARPIATGNEGSVAIGWGSSATGTQSNAFGRTALASGYGSSAFGYVASATGTYSIALGMNAISSFNMTTAIGANSGGTGSQAVLKAGAMALGGSYASGTDSFAAAVSNNTSSYGAIGDNSIAIGRLAKASAANSVAIGSGSSGNGAITSATANGAIALGESYASGVDSFAVGITNNKNTYGATGANNIAIGYLAKSSSTYKTSTALGPNAIANGSGSLALSACYNSGSGASAGGSAAIAIGEGSASASYSVAIGSMQFVYAPLANAVGATAIGSGSKASQYGKYAYSGTDLMFPGTFLQGAWQYGLIIVTGSTTTTTPVALQSDGTNGTVPDTTNQLVVVANQAMTFFGSMIAKQSASANMASYMIKGAIVNNSGTISVSSISIETIVDTIGLTTQPTFTANSSSSALTVTSGAKAATNIRWVCTLQTAEVIYA